jgi:hypothetical protein
MDDRLMFEVRTRQIGYALLQQIDEQRLHDRHVVVVPALIKVGRGTYAIQVSRYDGRVVRALRHALHTPEEDL